MFGEETQDVEVLPQSITAIPDFVACLGSQEMETCLVWAASWNLCVCVCACARIFFSGGGKRGVDLKCAVNDPLDT